LTQQQVDSARTKYTEEEPLLPDDLWMQAAAFPLKYQRDK